MKLSLINKTEAAADICLFELAAPDGAALPAFSAGAHVDVHLPGGLVRQYSLCNRPGETHRYCLGVLREAASRGGSAAMHALETGALLEVGAPRNLFPLVADARHSVLLAGGIGITPILAMAEQLRTSGASFELHYCTRSPARTPFRERLAEPGLREHTRVYHDDAPAAQRADLDAIVGTPDDGKHLYVCGPAGFIEAVLGQARAAGWREANLHREYFAAPPAEATGGAFQVKLAASGRLVEVGAEQSVVQALAAHGVEVPTSCEQGICGTCLTRVLEGEPDHRDQYLTDEERAANDQFLPCCSRARTPVLVLDL